MPVEIKKNNVFTQALNDNFDALLIGVVLIIFLGAYFFLIQPKYQATITTIKTNIANQEKIYFDQKTKLNNLKAAAALYEEIKKDNLGDVRKVNAVLPSDYVKERLFGEIEEIINQSGFLVDSLEISREEMTKESPLTQNSLGESLPKNIGRVRIVASVGAVDYAGLKNLLFTLENNIRLLDIDKISFSPTAKTATLEIYTYYFKPTL